MGVGGGSVLETDKTIMFYNTVGGSVPGNIYHVTIQCNNIIENKS